MKIKTRAQAIEEAKPELGEGVRVRTYSGRLGTVVKVTDDGMYHVRYADDTNPMKVPIPYSAEKLTVVGKAKRR